ncbi:MAG: hypothetical protein ACTSRG_22605 [Candidatus Helarchaeota archaeon]
MILKTSQMVGRYLKLLELPEKVQKTVAPKGYPFGKAYELTMLKFDVQNEPDRWRVRRSEIQLELAKSKIPLKAFKKKLYVQI